MNSHPATHPADPAAAAEPAGAVESGLAKAPGTPDRGPDAGAVQQARPRHRRRSLVISGASAAVLLAVMAGAYTLGGSAGRSEATTRQDQIAARGAQVMPFDLEATTHVFDDTADGGRQTVTADTPGDTEQVTLIREHLREEQAAFARGDFSDPAAIHGQDMPGLADLTSGADRIQVTYTDVPQGAVLTYTTTDPTLVRALHAWFAAQLSDHGDHAGTSR